MNLAELVDVVSYKTKQEEVLTRKMIKTIFETILKEVTKEGRVSIVGFGSFYQVVRKEKMGRNPQTGEAVLIPSCKVPRFRAGKDFKDNVRYYGKRKPKVK